MASNCTYFSSSICSKWKCLKQISFRFLRTVGVLKVVHRLFLQDFVILKSWHNTVNKSKKEFILVSVSPLYPPPSVLTLLNVLLHRPTLNIGVEVGHLNWAMIRCASESRRTALMSNNCGFIRHTLLLRDILRLSSPVVLYHLLWFPSAHNYCDRFCLNELHKSLIETNSRCNSALTRCVERSARCVSSHFTASHDLWTPITCAALTVSCWRAGCCRATEDLGGVGSLWFKQSVALPESN